MEAEAINDRLSANLRRAYTSYKVGGSIPSIASPLKVDTNTFQMTAAKQLPQSAANKHRATATAALPDIARVQSSYNIPTEQRQMTAASRLARSADQSNQIPLDGTDIVYEYEVDDAAGIPSLGFFAKPYSLPLNRQGRIGGTWRHIRQCTGPGGTNLLFVEGSIKDRDIQNYPPYGIVKSKIAVNHLGQRLIPKAKSSMYNEKAKQGFQYWYKEPKKNIMEPPAAAVRTISGNQYKIKGF